jgi:hypothetical protein
MNLFLDPSLHFVPLEKRAAEVSLPEDPNLWPQEILQEVYKQVPYISDFEPHIQMDTVDGERGYGFGHIRVNTPTQLQANATPDQQLSTGVKQARIPIIIRDRKLLPFDLLVTEKSKMQPLTESRLRQAIFRPEVFDVSSRTPQDISLVSQLYPPYRDSPFDGGGMTMNKGASVLRAILPTINPSDHQRFMHEIADEHVRASFVKNAEATYKPFSMLCDFTPSSLEKVAAIIDNAVNLSVVQIRKAGGEYILKTASHAYWNPTEKRVPRKDVVGWFGAKIAMEVDQTGATTIAEGAETVGDEDTPNMAPVEDPGLYKVRSADGDELVGYVIPNLLDTDGTPLPISLFTNGSTAAVQGSISGTATSDVVDLPTADAPSGYGSFFTDSGEQVQATIPLEIKGSYSGIDENEPTTYDAVTFDGRPAQVSVQPNIQTIIGTEDGRMLVPEHYKWVPLDQAGAAALASPEAAAEAATPESAASSEELPSIPDVKTASRRRRVRLVSQAEISEKTAAVRYMSSVQVRAGGPDNFSFSGPAVDKLAYAQREGVSLDDAMFLLAALGVEQGYGTTKLAHSLSATGPVRIRIGRMIVPAQDVRKEAMVRAEAKLATLPRLKCSLVKEASVIPDPNAVDTVLSLGFINPENLLTFVSYLPSIENTQSRLCELLVGARLGMNDVSTTALERAVRSVEETIEGLKTLAFQGP